MGFLKKIFLPHELFFGAFLLFTWVRLFFHVGFFHTTTLSFFFLIILNSACIYLCKKNPSLHRWKMRFLYYPIAMILSFWCLNNAAPILHSIPEDLFLQKIDHVLIGGNLSLFIQKITCPPLTELLSFCYLGFFPYLAASIFLYLKKNFTITKKFFSGLFTIVGVGFFCYTILPALGPYVAMKHQFYIPLLDTGLFSKINDFLIPLASNHCDVFPSLHCSVSSYILFFDRTHSKWRFKRYFLLCILIWISTIYLRYHYFIDILAGFVLASLALRVAKNYQKNDPLTEEPLAVSIASDPHLNCNQ